MAQLSNARLYRARGRAQGTSTWRTPCSRQATRGTRARNHVRNEPVSRCRQARSGTWSHTGKRTPHSGPANAPPVRCPRKTSPFFSSGEEVPLSITHGRGNASKSLKSPRVGMARSLRSEPPLYKTYPQETQMNHLNEGNDTPVKVRKHSESAGQNELPSSTSPAARVPSVRQVCKLIVSRMKCTEPSANRTLT